MNQSLTVFCSKNSHKWSIWNLRNTKYHLISLSDLQKMVNRLWESFATNALYRWKRSNMISHAILESADRLYNIVMLACVTRFRAAKKSPFTKAHSEIIDLNHQYCQTRKWRKTFWIYRVISAMMPQSYFWDSLIN